MNNLIKEIKSNLENKNYLSALALTLILPDICAKIEYPNINFNRKRYRDWYDKYIYPYELPPSEVSQYKKWVPNGDIIYQLRCNLLHDGSLDLNDFVKNEKEFQGSYNYKFILTNKVSSCSLSWTDGEKNKVSDVLVRIGVENFCKKICAVAENFYYNNYKDKDIYNDIIMFNWN